MSTLTENNKDGEINLIRNISNLKGSKKTDFKNVITTKSSKQKNMSNNKKIHNHEKMSTSIS
jgi:hypothetical protein